MEYRTKTEINDLFIKLDLVILSFFGLTVRFFSFDFNVTFLV